MEFLTTLAFGKTLTKRVFKSDEHHLLSLCKDFAILNMYVEKSFELGSSCLQHDMALAELAVEHRVSAVCDECHTEVQGILFADHQSHSDCPIRKMAEMSLQGNYNVACTNCGSVFLNKRWDRVSYVVKNSKLFRTGAPWNF